jgi:hypothetical protein
MVDMDGLPWVSRHVKRDAVITMMQEFIQHLCWRNKFLRKENNELFKEWLQMNKEVSCWLKDDCEIMKEVLAVRRQIAKLGLKKAKLWAELNNLKPEKIKKLRRKTVRKAA